MANPNIVNVATINGITTAATLSTTSATTILSNAVASGAVYKVNFVEACNVSNATANFTLTWNNSAAGGGTAYAITKNVGITTQTSLVVLDRASSIYLTENTSLVATSSASNAFEVVLSYENIS